MEIQVQETFEKVRIEEGFYPAVLRAVKDNGVKVFPAKPGKPENSAQQIILEFELIAKKEGKDQVITLPFFGYAPATKNNKLGQALEALGADLTSKKNINIDTLILKKCRVIVQDYTNKDGNKVSFITNVKPQ